MKMIKFLNLIACFILLLTSCNQKDKLLGKWERVGDKFSGLQIEVIKEGESFKAVIIKSPDSCILRGFIKGDVKWKNIKKTEGNKYELEDLMKKPLSFSDRFEFNYGLTNLELINQNEIRTRVFSKGLEDVGVEQLWIRVMNR